MTPIDPLATFTPRHSNEAARGYGRPRKRFDKTCRYCGGDGKAFDLRGAVVACPQCEGRGKV